MSFAELLKSNMSEIQRSAQPHDVPHDFQKCFFAPLRCSVCLEMILNLTNPGCECRDCGFPAHVECCAYAPKPCSEIYRDTNKWRLENVSRFHKKPAKTFTETGIPHSFDWVTFMTPTWCSYCKEYLWGITRQGLSCKVRACQYVIHEKCMINHSDNLLSCYKP
eukprot:TRINITY_DN9943_c0_g1_i1.p1 TRINITY_DN9943_c0_g1~~TRINITY_DN9943_c0_g1_i1.p1  ORF type:complete len:164 (-),score=35.45 TRINITY_DN9943_c0_g1_i1:70-561(-)